MRTELERERAGLARARQEINEGEDRIRHQLTNIALLRATGRDTQRAERLLELLEATLFDWKLHRAAMLQRLAHLEAELRADAAG